MRLMQAIGRAYRGVSEPSVGSTCARARSLEHELGGPTELARTTSLAREATRRLVGALRRPAPAAGDGCALQPGCGVIARSLGSKGTRRLLDAQPPDASLNDLAVAAAVSTIDRWNARHGSQSGRIAVEVPVNMRRRAWFWECAGNFASFLTISVPSGSRRPARCRSGSGSASRQAATPCASRCATACSETKPPQARSPIFTSSN